MKINLKHFFSWRKLQEKSFYTLEIFIDPGGGRMSWLLILNDLADVKKALASYFEEDERHLSMYCLLWYGTEIYLQTYQNGVRTQEINIIPFIDVNIHGYQTFKATNWEFMSKLQSTIGKNNFQIPDRGEFFFDSKKNEMNMIWDITTNWDAINVENLIGNKFENGYVNIYDHYLEKNRNVKYGIYENEKFFYKRKINWDDIWNIN